MIPLRGAQKLNHFLQFTNTTRSHQSVLLSIRHFSTDNNGPQSQSPPPPPPSQPESQSKSPPFSAPIDYFLHPPATGLAYGKLFGISPNTLKTDVINIFEGCNLTLDDIKVDYDKRFHPIAMMVQFPSVSDFTAAFRELARKNRSIRLEKADRQQWDYIMRYNGRYVLFQGIPRNALMDDVERLLSGCNYEASSLDVFTRSMPSGLIRMAKARFPSPIEAMNAVIRKNGAFCLNQRIVARLLQ